MEINFSSVAFLPVWGVKGCTGPMYVYLTRLLFLYHLFHIWCSFCILAIGERFGILNNRVSPVFPYILRNIGKLGTMGVCVSLKSTEMKYCYPTQLDTFNKILLKKSTNKQQEIQKKIRRAKLLMYSILHYITNCLYFHIISTTKKYI